MKLQKLEISSNLVVNKEIDITDTTFYTRLNDFIRNELDRNIFCDKKDNLKRY